MLDVRRARHVAFQSYANTLTRLKNNSLPRTMPASNRHSPLELTVPSPTTDNLAVLIDADNAQASVIAELLAEVAQYGTATVKRAYGDWKTPNLAGWKDVLHVHAIQPVQQFRYTASFPVGAARPYRSRSQPELISSSTLSAQRPDLVPTPASEPLFALAQLLAIGSCR